MRYIRVIRANTIGFGSRMRSKVSELNTMGFYSSIEVKRASLFIFKITIT